MNGLQLRSLVKSSGELELSLARVESPEPAAGEVLVRVEAAPLNPSDLGLLFGPADMTTAVASGPPDQPVVTAKIAPAAMKGMAGRMNESMPVGNEGAGLVVATGASPAAQALLGKRVALLGGAMYTQFRCIAVEQCLPLPEGASLFVNGAKNERTELVRLFTTPTLAPGKSYQYVMKAEISSRRKATQ